VKKQYRSHPTISYSRHVGVVDDEKIKNYKNGVASDGMNPYHIQKNPSVDTELIREIHTSRHILL
jgi:hypothetical protein